jgi:hypothetical protein
VCENEIPADVAVACPHCLFDLRMLDDDLSIERAKNHYEGVKITPKKRNSSLLNVIGGVVLGLIILFIFLFVLNPSEGFTAVMGFLYCLPLGLLAGLIIYLFEKIIKKINRRG